MTGGGSAAVRGLFLDFDGTLVDSLPALYRAYGTFLARFGRAGSLVEFNALNGPPLVEVVRLLAERHGLPGDRATLLDLYAGIARAEQAAARPMPGAATLLKAAKRAGWQVAVVTSTVAADAKAWLRAQALDVWVDCVVGGDHEGPGKPDPAPYRSALAITGADPALSLAVEDSRTGACAAIAAGLPTWQLAPSGESILTELPLAGAVPSLTDLLPRLGP